MTPEFGAASQLEKIDMLDFAEAVVINKFERRGAEDALRDVRRQLARNRERFGVDPADAPGVRHHRRPLQRRRRHRALPAPPRPRSPSAASRVDEGTLPPVDGQGRARRSPSIVPPERAPLPGRDRRDGARLPRRPPTAQVARRRARSATCSAPRDVLADAGPRPPTTLDAALDRVRSAGGRRRAAATLLDGWPARSPSSPATPPPTACRSRASRCRARSCPRVALPRYDDAGELLRFLRAENLPGRFPFTAGVFPLKREGEDPARMFAGEGDAFRTNRRFHLLAEGQPATRLSTAFDSVTLYGFDPDERPDIYGKVGNSGVSIATLDDMKVLYDGFDLCDPSTSVSMTINGPAPTILAMFLNTAIDQHPELEPAEVLRRVRGTVQADILKEDQGQNTCIFSTEFSPRGDGRHPGVVRRARGAQLLLACRSPATTSPKRARTPSASSPSRSPTASPTSRATWPAGLAIDDFAPNLSFFFSNGMDPEYAVLGRVARRIWAVAMRDRYGADERSQKLKYHVQTSGRSLHAQEMDFNDIRTTLQALIALYDNANSLHTNAYDEAVTTPTAESVRRALAIQLIINREWGLSMNENPNQGSFVIEQLTDLVEEAVLPGARADLRAGRRARRHGDRLPARPDPGRVDALRAPQARRHAAASSASTRSSPRTATTDETPPVIELARSDRRGEAEPARPAPRLPGRATPTSAPAMLGPPPRRRPRRRQPLRRADGRGPRLQPRRDHRRPVRGRRPLPPQRLTRASSSVDGDAGHQVRLLLLEVLEADLLVLEEAVDLLHPRQQLAGGQLGARLGGRQRLELVGLLVGALVQALLALGGLLGLLGSVALELLEARSLCGHGYFLS